MRNFGLNMENLGQILKKSRYTLRVTQSKVPDNFKTCQKFQNFSIFPVMVIWKMLEIILTYILGNIYHTIQGYTF